VPPTERARYFFRSEPAGESLEQLIALGRAICSTFVFIVRDASDLSTELKPLLSSLDGLILHQREQTSWPGTEYSGEAIVLEVALNELTAAIIRSSIVHLYDDLTHSAPLEDLSLIRPDGEPWLVSTSHEREAYLVLSVAERVAIARDWSLIDRILTKQPVRS
jgi:hypothetical protein